MGSTFGGTWEDPGGGFFEFAVKRAIKQDQIVHIEGKLQIIRYFSRECEIFKNCKTKSHAFYLYLFSQIMKKKKRQILLRATTKENYQMIFLTTKIRMGMYQPMICIESDNKEKFVKIHWKKPQLFFKKVKI